MTNEARVPGSRLRRFAARTFDGETLDRVVLPALADLQHECGDNDSHLVRLRAYWGIWKALALCLLINWGRDGRPTMRGVVSRMTIVLPIVVGLITIPVLNDHSGLPLAQFLMLSMPQTLAAALPLAFFFAVALERRPRSLRRLVPAVFAMALVCSLGMMVMTFSVVPRANRAFAEAIDEQLKILGRPAMVSFPPTEWSFTELVRRAQLETSERDRATARKYLGMRLVTSTLPIVAGFAALGIAGYPRMHTVFLGTWVLMFYLAALRAASPSSLHGPSLHGPSVRGVCVVNAAFVLGGLCLIWLRRDSTQVEPDGYVIS